MPDGGLLNQPEFLETKLPAYFGVVRFLDELEWIEVAQELGIEVIVVVLAYHTRDSSYSA